MMQIILRRVKRTLAYFLVFSAILGLAAGFVAWRALKQGVDFQRLSFPATEIRNLSLRLDRGLIIHVEQIDVDGQAAGNGSGLEAHIPAIKKWGYLIREIDIKRLNYGDHALTVIYRNGRFLVENSHFVLRAAIAHDAGAYRIELDELLVKPHKLDVSGTASYDRSTDRFHFSGLFRNPWASGSLTINGFQEQVDLLVSTDPFKNLGAVLEPFPIDEEVIAWVASSVSAGQYRIDQLRLRFPLREWRHIGPEHISGTAVADDAVVIFDPGLEPVRCNRVDISLHGDRLSFVLQAPRYKDRDLTGSSVHIDNVTGEGTRLVVHIRTETRCDEDIREILNIYDIEFPPLQRSGTTRADLKLTFDLPGFTPHAMGTFSAGPGEWVWGGVPFHAEELRVKLDNRKATIGLADVSYQDILRTRISGRVDFRKKHTALQCDIDYLDFRNKDRPILRASGIRLPVEVDFGADPVTVHFKEQDTVLRLGDGERYLAVGSLRAVKPLVPLLEDIRFSEGYLHVALEDMPVMAFNGEIEIPDTHLVLDGLPVTSFRFRGVRTPERIEASANGDRIIVTATDRVTFRLREYLVRLERNIFTDMDNAPSFSMPLTITGPKAVLAVSGLSIPTGSFEFNADGPVRTFGAPLEMGQFLYEANGEQLSFTGNGLDAEIAGNFIKFAEFTGGILNVTLNGTRNNYNGYIEFTEALVRDYLVMNNIIAFINTIPALATLSSPGFDQDGYRVQEGFVHFDFNGNLLTIRELRADGTTVNCEATGWVDFNDRNLNLSVELFTMKDYSRIIGLVPLAGYAILGEDGSLSTSLEVTGSLDEPVIQTNLARDILLSPLHIIRRTLEWPFRQLEKLNGHSAKPPEPAD